MPRQQPVRALTVLFDAQCRLCAYVAGWLGRQRHLVPLTLVPVGSEQARTWFPALDHDGAARREVTVVGDGGQLYVGDTAWVVCLWALADHRAFSHTLTTPAGRRLARAAVLTAARYRERAGRGEPAEPHRHPAPRPPRVPAGGTTAAGVGAGGPEAAGPQPVWEYDGSGGWTLHDTGGAGGAGGTGRADGGCTDGCSPPG
ncbi:thiol-disulfide oxidoreductase DCC family protein [Actinacidiphila rubida]|uniref:thiol-disulfide oxidoreductase DCC family protein n=1 Tax=Actinacidiphila rubida TaxID=310780 RepID=UPI0009450C8C|nr:DCC1-like thiol-disulfide oxidoreductase family protein [Actinacidiphila rubida]